MRALAPARLASDAIAQPARDETAILRNHLQAARDGLSKLPARARKHDFLLVPGLLYDVVDDYFQPNVSRLRDLKAPAKMLDLDPLGTIAENGATVAAALRAAQRPVIVIAHSKGALDTLEALKQDPELVKKVRALVAVQTPYFGAALADWALWPRWFFDLGVIAARLLRPARLLRTNPLARADAMRAVSKEARSRTAGPLPEGLAVYSVTSRLLPGTVAPWAAWLGSGALYWMTGQESDGLVGTRDAVLPGSRFAVLDHVSHIDTVSDPAHWKHRAFGARRAGFAADLTEAIVRWVLETEDPGPKKR